jgi:DNA polymerase-3 subunit alpha
MAALFADHPEALSNSVKIAERCSVKIDFDKIYLPHYEVPEGYNLDSYLEELCRQGLGERYTEITPEISERLSQELKIIKDMGFSGYFLVVWDFVRHAKSVGIRVGPGRGSAAGSLVAYALRITNLNPLKYGLLFERFLNPERRSMPDIDIDFDDERRDEIIEYVAQKYGRDRVAQIITFGTMKARAATRDAGRVLGFPYALVDRVAKLISEAPGATIEESLNTVPDLRREYESDEDTRLILDNARALEGMARQDSIHAAGVVISLDELTNYTPLQRKGDSETVTQYHMDAVKKIGLLKMDFLGLRTLTVIDNTLKIIKRTRDLEVDIDFVSMDDKKTFAMLRKGDSIGVFQLESAGMRSLLKDLKPTCFEDIINLLALYRPGPLGSNMVKDFVDCKHGQKEISYPHPALEPILRETHGIIVYQEQVMRIASEMAGFTMSEADILRGAMSKKKPQVIAEQREKFIGGAVDKGIDSDTAGRVFDLMAHFAGYGFNKCVVGTTQLIDAKTGELVTVQELFRDKRLITTLSCDGNLKIVERPVLDVVENGVKPVYRVTTRLGREIVVTDNHPFLTLDGWKELKGLGVGERIGIPRILPVEGGNGKHWDDFRLVVLAGVISEGNTCHPSGFYYYNNDEAQVKDFVENLRKFENTVPTVSVREGKYEVYAGTGRETKFRPGQRPWNKGVPHDQKAEGTQIAERSGARLWIEEIGLVYKKATEKFVPAPIFSLPLEKIALFLGRLWSGDGFIISSGSNNIPFYATSSKDLASQIQNLLGRFGILSRLTTKTFKYAGGLRKGYALYLHGRESIRLFIEKISPFIVNRSLQIGALVNYYESVSSNSESRDTIPSSVRNMVKAEKQSLSRSWDETEKGYRVCVKDLHERISGVGENFSRDDTRGRPQDLWMGTGPIPTKNTDFEQYADSEVYWDEISAVEYIGEEPTYDIEVADTHNFIADGIIVHNSHSAAYAVISYQTAYLKANYPVEFVAALLTSVMGNKDKVPQYVNECRRSSIEVLPPDVNESFRGFTAVGKSKIRFGLSAVRNIGENVIEAIIEGRKEKPFASLQDFLSRVDLSVINKRALDSLIKCGAFDSCGGSRKYYLSIYENAVEASIRKQRNEKMGQFSFFDAASNKSEQEEVEPVSTDEFPKDKLLTYEKEMLGLYVSDHPLLGLEEALKTQTDISLSHLKEQRDGSILWIGGIVSKITRVTTKKGDMMLFLTVEDMEGVTEVVVFPGTYQQHRDLLVEDQVLRIKGRVDIKEEDAKLIAQEIKPLEAKKQGPFPVCIHLREEKFTPQLLDKMKKIITAHRGSSPVLLRLLSESGTTVLKLDEGYKVNNNSGLFAELKELLGEDAVSLQN